MVYNNSFYKGKDIDNDNDINSLFNPYEYNIEGNKKDKSINMNNNKSKLHKDRKKINNIEK